ncbi:aminoglycoside phosphotransferase family protein [Nonomuraea sp. NPDC049625]|uniref:aminoglycoside phosphotransferase family protein n=1 Tax=Nonomuraea sp. NPDC049625 TaxID=3155775 RepID=UPI0034340770
MLGRPEIVGYLIDRGLLSPSHVVGDDLAVLDFSRRHVNFAVTTTGGPRYFLKQARDPAGRAALAREAAVYRHFQDSDDLPGILARYHSFDVELGVLLLEFGRENTTLRGACLDRRRPSVTGAATAGRGLARFHQLTGSADAPLPPPCPPWVVRIHRPGSRILQEFSATNIELIRIIQAHPRFGGLLDELADGYEETAFMHGDVRWDNCLLMVSERGRSTRMRLVDLELAGKGDAAWDVGCFFGEYLGSWVLSLPVTAGAMDSALIGTAAHPLDAMQPAIRAFWRSYEKEYERGTGRKIEPAFLRRAAAFAGGRLIQMAFEHTQEAPQMTSQAICLLQLSLNVMERPAEAAGHLLGIAA